MSDSTHDPVEAPLDEPKTITVEDAVPDKGEPDRNPDAKPTRAEIAKKASEAAAAKRAAAKAEAEANAPQFTELINIRHPNERILITEQTGTDRRGNPLYTWTGEAAQFVETRYLAYDDDVLDAILRAAPYVFIEPTEGEYNEHKQTGFRCRNGEAFAAWINSDHWAKE